METITKVEYLRYSMDNKLYGYLDWIYAMLSLGVDSDKYVKIKDGTVFVKVNDDYVTLITKTLPILNREEKLELPKGFLPNIEEDIVTDAFKLILNAILLTEHFGNKIPYINKEITVGNIENQIVAKLSDTDSVNSISIPELLSFQDACTYVYGFTSVVVNSNSSLLLLPPPGLKEYKKKVVAEVKKKYKIDTIDDFAIIAEIEEKLTEFDKEFLKDDPSYGKFISGKILNTRKKMFLSYGAETGFDDEEKPYYSQNSLYEGWEATPEAISTYYNGSRAGSFGRGGETAEGGLLAKIALRATNHIRVKNKDCKTKMGKELYIDKSTVNILNGKSILVSGKTIKVDNPSDYLGKTVQLRTVNYCNEVDNNLCSVCIGENLSRNETGVAGAIANFGNYLLYIKMKATHKTGAKLTQLSIDDMCV